MSDIVTKLVEHFDEIYDKHMRDLPIVNPRVKVEAVGFQDFEGHDLGVLITPWFMNLVLMPAGHAWRDRPQGDSSAVDFPSGPIAFTISHDEALGTYLTAVLFRSVSEMPDQATAREIGLQIMKDLFVPAQSDRSLSRRELLTGLRSR